MIIHAGFAVVYIAFTIQIYILAYIGIEYSFYLLSTLDIIAVVLIHLIGIGIGIY